MLNFVGAAESASFFVAWTIFTSLYYVGSSMGLSLLAEGASDSGRLRSLAADAAVMSVLPLLGLVVLMLVFAHPVMSVFGAAYAAEGASILRVFTITSVISAVLSIYLSIARTKGWMRSVAAVEVSLMVLALGAGAVLVPLQGPIGMAHAWLLAMLAVTCGVGVLALVTNRRHSVHDWGMAVAASLKRLSSQFLPFGRPLNRRFPSKRTFVQYWRSPPGLMRRTGGLSLQSQGLKGRASSTSAITRPMGRSCTRQRPRPYFAADTIPLQLPISSG